MDESTLFVLYSQKRYRERSAGRERKRIMGKKAQKKTQGIGLFEKAKIINHSVDNGKEAWKLVRKFVIPAAVVGFAVLAYAAFDIDVSGQARK